MTYVKSYLQYTNCGGLYSLVSPEKIRKRDDIIRSWRKIISDECYQIITPIIVPLDLLKESGHITQFENEVFRIDQTDLCLRPELAVSSLTDMLRLRKGLKGNPLKLCQIGKSFRREQSTRNKELRKNEFEQMEVYYVYDKPSDFFELALKKVRSFFKELGLTHYQVDVESRPHYSSRTLDLYVNGVEVGCINDRGNHDCGGTNFVYEISLGLDRLVIL